MNSFIDHIFYINLEYRTDRKEEVEKELNDFGLSFERFNAIKKDYGPTGCLLSHLEVLKLARERNYKNVLIFEDDFTFLVSKEEFETQIKNFFALDLPYDVLFLSYGLIQSLPLENNVVNKALECQTASGYIVHQRYYDKLIEIFEKSAPLLDSTRMHWIYINDQIWKQYQVEDQYLYFIKRIGRQRPSYSDLSNAYVDHEN